MKPHESPHGLQFVWDELLGKLLFIGFFVYCTKDDPMLPIFEPIEYRCDTFGSFGTIKLIP